LLAQLLLAVAAHAHLLLAEGLRCGEGHRLAAHLPLLVEVWSSSNTWLHKQALHVDLSFAISIGRLCAIAAACMHECSVATG